VSISSDFLLLSVPVEVIVWTTVSEMTYNVSSGTLLTRSLFLLTDFPDYTWSVNI